jgi:hypothetical protein
MADRRGRTCNQTRRRGSKELRTSSVPRSSDAASTGWLHQTARSSGLSRLSSGGVVWNGPTGSVHDMCHARTLFVRDDTGGQACDRQKCSQNPDHPRTKVALSHDKSRTFGQQTSRTWLQAIAGEQVDTYLSHESFRTDPCWIRFERSYASLSHPANRGRWPSSLTGRSVDE